MRHVTLLVDTAVAAGFLWKTEPETAPGPAIAAVKAIDSV